MKLLTGLRAALYCFPGNREEWPAAVFRARGARLAHAGVFMVAPAGWLVTRFDPSDRDVWEAACFVYAGLVMLVMGGGLLFAGLPEMLRGGPAARSFAAAEWRHLRGRPGGFGRVFRWGFGLVAWGGPGLLFAWLYASGRWMRTNEEFAVVLSLIALGFSLILPVALAVSAAVNLSASRRDGAAAHLLMGPLAADHLGWAAANAQARRGARMLLLALPLYAVAGLLVVFADSGLESEVDPSRVCCLLALGLLLELMMVRRAAVLGVWLGATVDRPGVAAFLAALGAGALLLARWAALVAAAVFADSYGYEIEYLDELLAVGWFVVCEWFCFACVVPLGMWAARSSLSAPLGLRLGPWLERVGERIAEWGRRMGSGEGPAAGGLGRWTRLRLIPRTRVSPLGWKWHLVWTCAMALAIGCLLALSREIAGESSIYDDGFWADYCFWGGLILLVLVTLFVHGILRRRRGAFSASRETAAGDAAP